MNAKHGLAFPYHPFMGTSYNRMLFDRKNKKILYVVRKKDELLDYAYITQWSHHWKERGNGSVAMRWIELQTTDFDRPRIVILTGSDQNTRDWMSRLDVICNRER